MGLYNQKIVKGINEVAAWWNISETKVLQQTRLSVEPSSWLIVALGEPSPSASCTIVTITMDTMHLKMAM